MAQGLVLRVMRICCCYHHWIVKMMISSCCCCCHSPSCPCRTTSYDAYRSSSRCDACHSSSRSSCPCCCRDACHCCYEALGEAIAKASVGVARTSCWMPMKMTISSGKGRRCHAGDALSWVAAELVMRCSCFRCFRVHGDGDVRVVDSRCDFGYR